MLILRKYSKHSKIKNKYNIEMVYKSRRINKSKRQSSRKRRMYGGDPDEIINKIEEENKIELPNIEKILG